MYVSCLLADRVHCASIEGFIGLQRYIFLGYDTYLDTSATIRYMIRIVVPRNNSDKLRFLLQCSLPLTLNPNFFHAFDLNEDSTGCDSTEEDILMNELHVFAVGTQDCVS